MKFSPYILLIVFALISFHLISESPSGIVFFAFLLSLGYSHSIFFQSSSTALTSIQKTILSSFFNPFNAYLSQKFSQWITLSYLLADSILLLESCPKRKNRSKKGKKRIELLKKNIALFSKNASLAPSLFSRETSILPYKFRLDINSIDSKNNKVWQIF